jgi:hypothetical protein
MSRGLRGCQWGEWALSGQYARWKTAKYRRGFGAYEVEEKRVLETISVCVLEEPCRPHTFIQWQTRAWAMRHTTSCRSRRLFYPIYATGTAERPTRRRASCTRLVFNF